jgi:hypothetical protein
MSKESQPDCIQLLSSPQPSAENNVIKCIIKIFAKNSPFIDA